MQFTLKNAPEIGQIIRTVRKAHHIRQDDAAGSVGVSESFLGKVEKEGLEAFVIKRNMILLAHQGGSPSPVDVHDVGGIQRGE